MWLALFEYRRFAHASSCNGFPSPRVLPSLFQPRFSLEFPWMNQGQLWTIALDYNHHCYNQVTVLCRVMVAVGLAFTPRS